MIMKELFKETKFDFPKKCKLRIGVGIILMLLGIIAATLGLGSEYFDFIPQASDFGNGFYSGTGFGLIGASLITVIKNVRYLKNEELAKKRSVYESDERIRMIGLKCWSYSGYALFLGLYIAILICGSQSDTIMSTLLAVMGAFTLLLLIFKKILSKTM